MDRRIQPVFGIRGAAYFTLLLIPMSSVASLVSAVLPASRSAQVDTTVTVFATMINAGVEAATNCGISLSSPLNVDLTYQTTDPVSNALTGVADTPVTIAAGASQSFVIGLTPRAPFNATDVSFSFDCANTQPAPSFTGLNTLLLSSSATGTPDVVALAATPDGDGVIRLKRVDGTGAFAISTVNLGTAGALTVTADTGDAALPVALALCETDALGACISDLSTSVSTSTTPNATQTFAIFPVGSQRIRFDPALSRIFIRFADAQGDIRGATSVAVSTLTTDIAFPGGGGIALRPGSLPDDVVIQTETVSPGLLPEGAVPIGDAVRITASAEIDVPVELRFTIPPGTDTESLFVYRVDESDGTTILPGEVDGSEFVTDSSHFSEFGVMILETLTGGDYDDPDFPRPGPLGHLQCPTELLLFQTTLCTLFTSNTLSPRDYTWRTNDAISISDTFPTAANISGDALGRGVVTVTAYTRTGFKMEASHDVEVVEESSQGTLDMTFFVNDTQVVPGATRVRASVRANTRSGREGPVAFAWDFGDGTTGNATVPYGEIFELPEHVYQSEGAYALMINGVDTKLDFVKGSVGAVIIASNLQAFISGPPFLSSPRSVRYTAQTTSRGPPASYQWSTSIPSQAIVSDPDGLQTNIDFQQAGEYVVTLTVTDNDNNEDTVGTTVVVRDTAAGSFTANLGPPSPFEPSTGESVSILATASGGRLVSAGQKTNYTGTIRWGDTTSERVAIPAIEPRTGGSTSFSHTYEEAGSYTISSVFWDATGSRIEPDSVSVNVQAAAPQGNFVLKLYQNFDGSFANGDNLDFADADLSVSGATDFPTFSWSGNSVIAITVTGDTNVGFYYGMVARTDDDNVLQPIVPPILLGDYSRPFTLANPDAANPTPAMLANGESEYTFQVNAENGQFAMITFVIQTPE